MKAELLNITAAEYHAGTFCETACYSNSIGKVLLSKSPLHAKLAHPKLNPDYEGDDATKFAVGKVAHAALLEGLDICVVVDAADWRTNDAKAERDQAYLAGKVPLLRKQFDQVKEMVEAAHKQIEACPDLGGIKLSDGKSEQTILLSDGDTRIKMRLDWLKNDSSLILDYKSTDIANPESWMKSISAMGGDTQAALYTRGVEVLTGKKPAFVFAIQETEAPYAMYFVGMGPEYLDYGQRRSNHAIRVWKSCMATNRWPAYDKRIMYPELPGWVEGSFLEREMIEAGEILANVSKVDFFAGDMVQA
jgi:hypothetical protein